MKRIVFFIAIMSAVVSCKKSWLQIVQLGDQIAVTTDDYNKLMNDPMFYQYTSGGWGEAQLMGDEIAAETQFFMNKGVTRDRLFQWQDSIYPLATTSSPALKTAYLQFYQINKVIMEVMGSQGGTDQQKRGILAEAKATRAWAIFSMAQYYCKPYDPTTAGQDLGFPFPTEPNISQMQYTRGTVQSTYDFIIKDLTDALADIPMKQGFVTRMSKPAVEGLLGKVYLFMGKYNEALPLLKQALADVTINGQTSLYDYNAAFAPGGAFLPINATNGPKSPGQILTDVREAVVSKIYPSGRYAGNQTGNDGLVLTPQAQALYAPDDLRLMLYTNKQPNNVVNPSGRIRKYGVAYSRWGLQLPELYLLSAEAKARTGDLGGAVADLETLRRNRMPVANAAVPGAIAADKNALIKFIIDERLREFALEGYRWLDMRRLSVDPLFAGATYTHTMYNANGTTTVYTLKAPARFTMKLPRNVTDGNPGMPDNP